MMEAEMDTIGYGKYQHSEGTNYRNGVKKKKGTHYEYLNLDILKKLY